MKVLIITSEWPTKELPYSGKFVHIQVSLLKAHGVEVTVFPFRGRKNPLRYLKYILRIKKLVKINDFDLVHCQFGQSGLLGMVTKLPMVITYRGTDLNGFLDKNGKEPVKSKILRALSRWAAKKADKVITVSHKLSAKLPSNISYKVLPSSLNLELFKPINQKEARAVLGLNVEKKVLFFPADPNKIVKRFHLAEQAFKLFQKRYADSTLIVAGRVDFQTMPYYYNAADAIVFTSSSEGSPNAIKEAMACNIPIVTVDVGDVRERLETVDGCYIVKDAPQNIANALIKVIDEQKKINTREKVMHLAGNKLTDELISIYKEVVEDE